MSEQVSKAALAREAGVSTTTLTRYLGGQSVADETREAIQKAAKKLGVDVTVTNDGSPAHPELQRPPADEPEPALPPEATPPEPKVEGVDLTAEVKAGKLDAKRSFRVLTIEETGKPRVGTDHTHTLLIETETKAGTQQKKIALASFPKYGKVLELAE
jgi:transcriptional regulator with XRE-family HTH domain